MDYEISKDHGTLTVTEKYKCFSKSTKRIWRDFYNNTSWHGVRPIFHGFSSVRTIIWIVLVVAALGAAVYFLYLDVCLFMDHPLQQVTTQRVVTKAVYPNIKICPSVPYLRSFAQTSPAFLAWAGPKLNKTGNWNITIDEALALSKTDKNSFRFTFRNDFSFTGGIAEHIPQCYFNGRSCEASRIRWIMNDDGLCAVINNNLTTVDSGWAEDSGMTLVFKMDHGMDVLPVQVDMSLGFKVSFFYDDDFSTGRKSQLVDVGKIQHITLRESEMTRLSSQEPESDCADPVLSYGKRYSVGNCLTACRIDGFEKTCGCGWPFIDGSTQQQCSSVEYTYCIETLNATRNVECDCPSPCNSKSVDVHSTSSSFVIPLVKDLIQDPLITNDEDYSKRYAVVKIFFDPAVQKMEVKDSFPFSSLLAHVGGLLALFIGWSVLTFFELLDALLRLSDSCCVRTKKEVDDDFFKNNLQLNETGTAHTVNEQKIIENSASWKHRNGVMEY